ncbi:MAG TPA: LemA family protein [bacterium]|nr:LemA family protein [bacterium]HQO92990.1 LemA family protein [bacterium]
MTATLIFLAILLALVVIAAMIFIGIYNGLVGLRNRVKNSWSQIDVQLKRRHDLIPNLVETAKGYMKHENQTFVNVTEARAKAMNAGNGGSVKDIGAAEADLSGSLAKMLLTVENYPELKANQNFLALQEELTSTENKIAFSRQAYNDDVMLYNNKTEMFPSNIIAGMFNFEKSEFFEIEDKQEKLAPKVSFN